MSDHRLRWALFCVAAGYGIVSGISANASQTLVVKPGDSIDSLARKYHLSTKDIARANGISTEAVLIDGHKVIIPDPPKGVQKPATMHKPGIINGDRITIRLGPNENYRRVTLLDQGAAIQVTAKAGEWSQVTLPDGKNGWVKAAYISANAKQVASVQDRRAAKDDEESAPKRHRRQVASSKKHSRTTRVAKATNRSYSRRRHNGHSEAVASSGKADVVRTAYAYRGTPYHFGASGRGAFDCSGFTSYVYRRKGVALPHSAAGQFEHGKRVGKSSMKPGDLVFFHTTRHGISHVGIYAGNGKFVHASSAGGSVRVDSLNSGYYSQRFRGARRVK